MIQKVANGRFEVERVDGTESVWWCMTTARAGPRSW